MEACNIYGKDAIHIIFFEENLPLAKLFFLKNADFKQKVIAALEEVSHALIEDSVLIERTQFIIGLQELLNSNNSDGVDGNE